MLIRECDISVAAIASSCIPAASVEKIGDPHAGEAEVRAAAASAFIRAHELRVDSVAFAVDITGGTLPALAVAKIYGQEVYRYLRDKKATVRKVVFCVFDPPVRAAFESGIIGYLTHVTEELQRGPFTTVDAIIEVEGREGEIVVIERSNPPFGFALPGGFVEYGESLEDAAAREAHEETGLRITQVRQMHTYSDPARDPRFHTIGTVFTAKAQGDPIAGDDAAALRFMKLSEVGKFQFAFDHKQIIEDYIESRKGNDPFKPAG